jgi:hypothetical protein
MFSRAILILILGLWAVTAFADGIYNPYQNKFGSGVGDQTLGGGINNLGVGGTAVIPTSCTTGAIDLSTGCKLPMLGG